VLWRMVRVSETDKSQGWRIDVTNARNVPIRAEFTIPGDLVDPPPGMKRGQGGWILPLLVPANDSATLVYRLKEGG
jgi:hypothetical protein